MNRSSSIIATPAVKEHVRQTRLPAMHECEQLSCMAYQLLAYQLLAYQPHH